MVDFNKPGEPSEPSGAGQSPQPGWYADPENPSGQRWWDGSAWSDHRQPAPPAGGPTFTGGAGGQGGQPGGGPTFTPPAPGPLGGPGPAYGAMTPAEERNWAIGAHLSALVAAWAALGFIGPLVVYLIKKDESPWVRAHAAAALNFHLSWLIWGAMLGIATFLLLIILIGIVLVPVLIAMAVAWLVLVIQHTIAASRNEPPKKYPLTIDFVS